MTGYQIAALFVGIFGGMLFLMTASENESKGLRFFGLAWLALWCIPPLVVLWLKSVVS